ncbi:hypothetical protein ATCC90586_000286 [Pythium insidiosum]|nr:hypothetical protein ATCC90586_000286 [Pythium insidiosum]
MRPSSTTRESAAHLFADTKLANVNVRLFTTDVLMEGELDKKGEGGLQTWKSRMFVLRGQELSYYTVEGGRSGAQKGSMNVAGAVVERLDGYQFAVTLSSGSTRIFSCASVQALMDWMTALSIAVSCVPVAPPSDKSFVDHSRTTHILLIRHGQYVSSTTPSQDSSGPLTPLGVQQARATGQFLRAYLEDRQVLKRFPEFRIYHSGVRRTVETAQHIAQCFPPGSIALRENKLVREAWPGNPLPSSNRKVLAREKLDNMVSDCARVKIVFRMLFRHLIPDDLDLEELQLDASEQQAFTDTFGGRTQHRPSDRYRVVVCHANIIRWFVCKALGVDPEGTWGRMRYNHCAVTAMEVDSVGNVQLAFLNQVAHLGAATQITEN